MDVSRLWVGTVLPLALVAVAVLPWALAWGELPDPVASHFAFGGEADDRAPRAVLAGIVGVVAVGTAAGLAVAARRPSPALPAQAGVLAFVGSLLGVVGLSTVAVNHGLDDWRQARLAPGWVVVTIGAAVAVCALTARAAVELAPAPAGGRERGPVPMAPPPAPGEGLTWSGSARSRAFLVATAVVAAAGAGLVVAGQLAGGLVVLATAAPLALFGSVHVVVDGEGVRVRSALPWPRVRLPLAEVEVATAPTIRPLERGGWGYRGSLRLFRRAAWVLRSGPALELELTGGRRFTVTVDGAEGAAGVVNALVAARRSRGR